jgi:hypothetical protein
LKYKAKYLNLKNSQSLQVGSGFPTVKALKNINLFKEDTDYYNFLSPIHGFITVNTGFIYNYHTFYSKDTPIVDFIKKCFTKINHQIRLTKDLFSGVTPKDYGILLGQTFILNKYGEIIKEIKKKDEKIKSNLVRIERMVIKFKEENKAEYKDYCKKKQEIEDLKKTQLELNFSSINSVKINDKIKKLNSDMKKHMNDKYFYHVLLACLWWISNNKLGIKEYYLGINEVFSLYKTVIPGLDLQLVVIPENWENDEFTTDDLKNKLDTTFELALGKLYINKRSELPIYEQEYSKIIGYEFPDCGECVLRNFINLLLYDGKSFELSILDKYEAIEKLKEYYRVFYNYDLQSSSYVQDIFETKLNSRDAWAHVVSNLPNVKYSKYSEEKYFAYELDTGLSASGISNFLQIIKELFKKIENFSDFSELNVEAEELDEFGFGDITVEKNDNVYEIKITEGHYQFTTISTSTDITYEGSPVENVILESMKAKIYQYYLYEKGMEKYFIYYELSDPRITIELLDSEIFGKDYKKILSWALKKYDDDKKSRIYPRIEKANGVDLSFYGVEYDAPDSYDYDNIIGIDFYLVIHFNLHDLKKIRSVYNYNGWRNFDSLGNPIGIPKTIKELFFSSDSKFDSLVNFSNYELTHLSFGNSFNKPVVCLLPKSLEFLTFGYSFNQPVNFSDYTALKFLTFGDEFDQPVDNLPNSLTHLTFGNNFDQPVNFSKCSILTHLTFGNNFDQPVDEDNLPNSITHLTFGEYFNYSVDNLPTSLTHLTFGDNFSNYVDNLPANLTHLTFGDDFNNSVDNLPANLTHLTFGDHFNKYVDNLPTSLTHLTLGNSFDLPIKSLPPNITHLTFGYYFDQPINEGILPSTITYLDFGNVFNQSIEKLPESLTTLIFSREQRKKVNFCNLYNLTKLVIPNRIIQYVPEFLMPYVKQV